MPEPTLARMAIDKFPAFQPMECPEVKIAWFNAYAALHLAAARSTESPAHPEAPALSSQQEPNRTDSAINHELLTALKDARAVLKSCADDTAGTPTETFFRSKLRHYDIVIAKAEGRNA